MEKSSMNNVEMVSATLADEVLVRSLLRDSELPHADIRDHLPRFVLAIDESGVAGVVGLEVHGHSGLLRSLAVQEDRRNRGLATALVEEIVRRARRGGVRELYLLTTTAAGFFSKLGFEPLDRTAVPGEISSTEEFRSLCPASAVCMRRPLPIA